MTMKINYEKSIMEVNYHQLFVYQHSTKYIILHILFFVKQKKEAHIGVKQLEGE